MIRLVLAFERRGAQVLSQIPEEVARLPRMEMPLLGSNIVGLEALRSMFAPLQRADTAPSELVHCHKTSLAWLILSMNSADPSTGSSWSWARVASERRRWQPLSRCRWQSVGYRSSENDGPSTAHLGNAPVRSGRTARQLHRSKRRSETLSERTLEAAGHDISREARPAGGRIEVALLRGGCRVSGVLAHGHGSEEGVRGHRHRPTGHTLLLLDTAGAYHRQMTQQHDGPGRSAHR